MAISIELPGNTFPAILTQQYRVGATHNAPKQEKQKMRE